MSNYTQIVSYGPKDALALNDAGKFIKGVQIDAELQAIATAVATKLDSTGGALTYNSIDITPTTGSFTGTFTNMTATITASVSYFKLGSIVYLVIPSSGNGTSNSNSFSMTGLIAALQPVSLNQQIVIDGAAITNAGTSAASSGLAVTATVAAGSGTITFLIAGNNHGWNTTGTKGFTSACTFSYVIL